MSAHTFNMRLNGVYAGADNTIEKLSVETEKDGAWQPFDLNLLSPGFSIYVYSLFTCQHTYFRINCAEAGLELASCNGSLQLAAGDDWMIDKLHVDFGGVLRNGEATADLVEHVIERMSHCPVSRNTRDVADSQTRVRFD